MHGDFHDRAMERINQLAFAVMVAGIVLLLALVAWRGYVDRHRSQQGIAPQVEQVRSAVVHVSKQGPNGPECQGSGCIIDPEGIIFTAKHITDHRPGEYVVTLDDGKTTYQVKYAVEDKDHDVAFLLLDLPAGVKLPAVPLADLATMRVGDAVFTMGSPLGSFNRNSVSLGILSAMQRDLESAVPLGYGWRIMFQADNPGVYPGNSGGPVFNMAGEVVGVLVAVAGPGLNYSVPVAVFKNRLDAVRTWFALSRFVPVPEEVPEVIVTTEELFDETGLMPR